MFWLSKYVLTSQKCPAVIGPHRHQRNITQTQKKTTEQRKDATCVCLDLDAVAALSMKLTVTLTSNLQRVEGACMMYVSHITCDYLHVCMHASAVHTFEFLCVHMWHLMRHTEPSQSVSVFVLQPLQDPTQLQPLALNSSYFCLTLLPLAEPWLGKLPSCFTLFIGQQLREQTRTKCHSQPEREPRGRAQSEGETRGRGCVCLSPQPAMSDTKNTQTPD